MLVPFAQPVTPERSGTPRNPASEKLARLVQGGAIFAGASAHQPFRLACLL